MIAAWFSKPKTMKVLLAHSVDVNATDNKGHCALISAAGQTYADVVELLLQKGANVNARDQLGDTALMAIFGPYHKEPLERVRPTVECLLQHGASVQVINNEGASVLSLAETYGDQGLRQRIASAVAQEGHWRGTATLNGVKVVGSAEFGWRTAQALERLTTSATWKAVKPYLSVIREAKRSGMLVWDPHPTFEVGKGTWQTPTLWYASTIVHDAYHSKLYQLQQTYAGKEGERKCLRVQIQAIRDLGGDAATEGYLQSLIPNPTYQDVPPEKQDW